MLISFNDNGFENHLIFDNKIPSQLYSGEPPINISSFSSPNSKFLYNISS